VANEFIKAEQIVQAASLLLQREIVLPRLVWTQPDAAFRGALDDTVTLRVPAVREAKSRTMRSSDALDAEDLTETSVPVVLDTHVYDLLNITDEQLTLDVFNFTAQVLAPQMRGVVEGMENVIASALAAATWEASDVDFAEGSDDGFDVLIEAGRELNKLNVPRSGRVFCCGANVEAALFGDDRVVKANEAGTDSALREATIARLAGFTVVGSNALDEDEAYAFHMTAIAFANVAPALPDGATMKARVASEGLALRYLRDYNPTNSSGPVDRSLVDAFVGATSVEQDGSNKRGVAINFTPANGS
jgi:hypothetical protein